MEQVVIIIPKPGTLWRHIASGGVYTVRHIAFMEDDYSKVIVYQDPDGDGPVWVRPVKEWAGRFEYVKGPL